MRRGLIVLTAALLAALTLAPGSAGAAGSGWHLFLHDSRDSFTDISALSASDIWAVGSSSVVGSAASRPLVEHWTGHGWHAVTPPRPPGNGQGAGLTQVVAQTARSVWAVGFATYDRNLDQEAFEAHWNGSHWTTHPFGPGWVVRHIAVLSRSNEWFLGFKQLDGPVQHPVYAHWNGRSWSTGALPAIPEEGSGAVGAAAWAPARDATTGKALLLHWTGSRWVRFAGPPVTLPRHAKAADFDSTLPSGSTGIWLTVGYEAGDGEFPGLGLWHWNGSHWQHVLQRADEAPFGMASSTGQGVWINSEGIRVRGALLHVSGGKVTRRVYGPMVGTATTQLLRVVRSPGNATLWAVGQAVHADGSSQGVIAHYDP